MKRLTLFLLCALISVVSSEAASIYWVSFHSADNTPSAGAATAGFTNAPDIGYTRLLRNNGHTVTRVVSSGTPNTNLLNAADLVIISRSVPSGDYQDPPETAAWNGITAPTIIMGGYVLRNSRLGYTTGGTIPDATNTVSLTALVPGHPIFAGIPLDGGNTMVNPYANIVTYTNTPQRGISVNTDPVAGSGTVLGTISSAGAPAGGLIIGEWQAGAIMGDAAPPDTLGGHRLVFLSGSREVAGLTAEGSGIYDLTAAGAQLFLNAVNYMAPGKVITVNTTNQVAGAGETNLTQAILMLEDGDTIRFNIPGPGPHYLQTPTSGFPIITQDNVTIDGYSQPGASPNSNPITSSNNAQIKIVLDSRNSNYRVMEYTAFTPANSSPPIDNTSMSTERGGYGDTEVAILGVYRAINVNVRGLAFLGDTYAGSDPSTYMIAVAHDYGLDTNVLDSLAYDEGSSRNCHINGCWFGVDPANPSVAGLTRTAAGIAFFRHREANPPVVPAARPELPNESLIIGVKPGSSNPRAQFNVMAYMGLSLAGEAVRTRFSGNFLGVLPDGVTPSDIGVFGGGMEIGRYDDTQPIVVGTDGDGVSDADEGNLFGPLVDGGVVFSFYNTGNKPYVVAGNRFGIAVDGTRWANSQIIWDDIAGGTKVQFGSDFDGVSDSLEANQVYNNYPAASVSSYPQFIVLNAGTILSLRGNTLVNNFTLPVDPTANAGQLILDYYAKAVADTNNGIVPVLSTNSTVARLLGTAPLPSTNYPVVIVDVYIPDPEGITNGIAAGIPELPDGFVQGKTYLGSFVVDGPADLDPAAGAFEFNIASLSVPLNTLLTVTANYQAVGGPDAPTITSLFAVPTTAKPGATGGNINIGSVTRAGSNLTLNWTGGTPPYQVQTRANLSGATWANDPTAVITGTSATVTISGNEGYYRVQGQ